MSKKLLSLLLAIVMVFTLVVPTFAASNSQVVVAPDTRIWQDGFGFHCNCQGGNGATAVEYTGSNAAIIKSIAGIKKQPAGSMVVEKGDQKDIFGTKTFPITLERVDMTTTWNLMTEDIKCATCGRTDWVTYSNNSGVINGKNIQAHHGTPSNYAEIIKIWEDGNPNSKEAVFDIYKFDGYNADDGTPKRGDPVITDAKAGISYELVPGTYVVAEQEKEGYEIQADQVITVSYTQKAEVTFVNVPRTIVNITEIFLKKYLKVGDEIVEWNDEHPLFADNEYIWFDLYASNEAGDRLDGPIDCVQVDYSIANGGWGVAFYNLTIDNYYFVEERIDVGKAMEDDYIGNLYNYATPLPTVHFQAKKDAADLEFDFNPEDVTDTGIITRKNVIISTDRDVDLKAASGNLVAHDDDSASTAFGSEAPVVPNWKAYMISYNGGGNFFTTLDNIWLDDAGVIRPEFIWNTKDFKNPDLAEKGSVDVFTKKFEVLETLTDKDYKPLAAGAKVPFYITGDNAFIVFVNGIYVGKSDAILYTGDDITLDNYEEVIGNLRPNYLYAIPMETWAKVYDFDIRDALIPGAENTITIVAINAADDGNQNYYNEPLKNPAGFIFGCEIFSISEKYRFVNELPGRDPVGRVTVSADVNLFNNQNNYKPIYDYVGSKSGTIVSQFIDYDIKGWLSGNSGPQGWFKAEDGDRLYLATGNKHDRIDNNFYYDVAIGNDNVILTFNGAYEMNVAVSVYGTADDAANKGNTGHGQQQWKKDVTETDNVITIAKPDGDGVYIVLHIEGAQYYYEEPKLAGWEYCCIEEIACTAECGIPDLTVKIYDTEGKEAAEADLEDEGLLGLVATFDFEDLGLAAGDYTIKLFNGEDFLGEKAITVGTENITEIFDSISLRCGCEAVINEDLSHAHE